MRVRRLRCKKVGEEQGNFPGLVHLLRYSTYCTGDTIRELLMAPVLDAAHVGVVIRAIFPTPPASLKCLRVMRSLPDLATSDAGAGSVASSSAPGSAAALGCAPEEKIAPHGSMRVQKWEILVVSGSHVRIAPPPMRRREGCGAMGAPDRSSVWLGVM